MGKHSKTGNGDSIPAATPGKLLSILGRANSERTQQEAFWRVRYAIERARQARIRERIR